MNAIIPRNTVEQIVSFRDAAVAAYHEAFTDIVAASDKLREAASLWKAAAGEHAGSRYGDQANEVKAFFDAVNLPDREQYFRTAVRLIDISCWHYLIQITDLDSIMDRKAKDELRDSLKWVPELYSYKNGRFGSDEGRELVNLDEIMGIPPVTIDNIYATIDKWAGEAEMIFRRGIATAFSSLDRRFRSHDGFKVGGRVVLTHAFNDYGSFQHGSTRDTLIDIERTFCILDGRKPNLAYGGICGVIENGRRNRWEAHQSEHDGEYFRVRAFKNGNAHLWFTRDDLVEKVNKMLAEYYGETIGDGMTKEADPLKEVKNTPAKNFGFFPTPDDAAAKLFERFPMLQRVEEPQLICLEPSAGTGNLARRCIQTVEEVTRDHSNRDHYMEKYRKEFRFDNVVDCVEVQPHLAAALTAEGIYRKVYPANFLTLRPSVTGLYDQIIMNPPFDRERDIDHVMHALDFLKPDGWLTAIMSAGTEFRETRKSIAFRALIEKMGGVFKDLPPGSFAESGTYINTIMVRVCKDGRKISWW